MKITSEEAQVSIASSSQSKQAWEACGVSIDSRSVNAGDLFIAIKGPRFDGHDFVQQAIEKGAVAIVANKELQVDLPVLIVSDTLRALQDLAHYKRNTISAKIIGVTGSVGKTSTKEIIFRMLSCYGPTYRSAENFNNHFGLPLSFLNAGDGIEYIVLEFGMNGAGEIACLSKIIEPDISIITNIGHAHLEFFASRDGIANAKAEIFDKTRGVVILNKDDEYYDHLHSAAQKHSNIDKIISISETSAADIMLRSYNSRYVVVYINGKVEERYAFPTIYRHLISNTLFAVAVLNSFGLDIKKSMKSLSSFAVERGRGDVNYAKNFIVIDDTYNSSPSSVVSSLAFLHRFSGRNVAILGDMLELGVGSKELHKNLLNTVKQYNIDLVFTVGDKMQCLYEGLEKCRKGLHFDRSEEVDIVPYLKKGDVILVKGSRSIKMEFIVKKLLSL